LLPGRIPTASVLSPAVHDVLAKALFKLRAEGRVLVAYSGGPDSTCLLHSLHEMGLDIAAAHLNHGQRPENDAEADACAEFCRARDIPFLTARADVPLMAKELKMSIEEAGRRARYAFLDKAADQMECAHIATAHTQDDQVETVLFNIIRGAGMSGMAGIPPERGRVIRPLLEASRAETAAYCAQHGLAVVDDPANHDLQHSRSRLRKAILPELEQAHPGARASLLRLSETAAAEDEFLNGMAAAALESCEIPLNGELRWLSLDAEVRLDAGRMRRLPPVLARRGIRLAAKALGGRFDHPQTLAIFEGLAASSAGSITGDGGEVVAEWTPDHLDVRLVDLPEPFRHPLSIPGAIESDSFGWSLEAAILMDGAEPWSPAEGELVSEPLAGRILQGGLHFRTLAPGEKMQPLGEAKERSAVDVVAQLKLTALARRRLPIVCDMTGPVWVPGRPIAARAAANVEDGRRIQLRLRPLLAQERS